MGDRGYISSASSNLTEVIVSLLEALDRARLVQPNDVQTCPPENGKASALIVLTAIVIEGVVNRLRYFADIERSSLTEHVAKEAQRRDHVLDWLKTRLRSDLHEKCEEVFCIRDAIAHAHTWNARTLVLPTLHFAKLPVLHSRYGDKRFRRVIDERTRRSQVLRLNAFPTRIWRRDAYLAYQTMTEVIAALEPLDPIGMDFSNWGYHSFKGEDLLLPEIARRLLVPDDP